MFSKLNAIDLANVSVGLTAGGAVVTVGCISSAQQLYHVSNGLIYTRDGYVVGVSRELTNIHPDDVVIDLERVPATVALPADTEWALARVLFENFADDHLLSMHARDELTRGELVDVAIRFAQRWPRLARFSSNLIADYSGLVNEEGL